MRIYVGYDKKDMERYYNNERVSKMDFREKAKEIVNKMTLEEKISQISHMSKRIDRLNIPAFNWWGECLHGVAMAGDASAFPQCVGMAASFDKELMEKVGDAIGDEIRAKHNEFKGENGDTYCFEGIAMCTPNINIFRDPRWGRGQETFGEDPHLTGVMASAYINGLQGDGKYLKIAATLKHMAVHSGPEGDRHHFSAEVSEKDLYETYLAAFKYCIAHCDIQTVMTAYSAINGTPCVLNENLIENILRKEFGFKGFVDSDLMSIEDMTKGFKICKDDVEAAAKALNAGCDLDIGTFYPGLLEAYNKGLVSEERITEACERVMTTRVALGCFDEECEYNNIPYDVVRCDKHKAVNLKMAQDSIVLLKNDGVLPLKKDVSIAVIGPNSNDKDALMGYMTPVVSEYTTFYQGIKEQSRAEVYWAYGCKSTDADVNFWSENFYRSAVMTAKRADVVVMFMGLTAKMEGEEGSTCDWAVNGDKPGIELPESQKILLDKILELGKPVIFVNVSGSCMNLSEQNEKCNAVLQCFYPGEMGGKAMADILFGNVSPSGRLPVTFYASTDDLPEFTDYSMENRTYRYFRGTPLYPFGYGLSYTDFEYSNIKRGNKCITVDVKNTGNMDGAHSVLVYGKTDVYSLIGFEKVYLKRGEVKNVVIGYEQECEELRIGSDIYV